MLSGKVALVRVDFNVPMKDGVVLDDARIRVPFNTIRDLQSQQAKIVLLAHLGKTTTPNESQSLKLLIPAIEKIYEQPVVFIDDCLVENAKELIEQAPSHSLILLENLRFHVEEEQNNLEFAEKLASLGDFFINDAFSVSHRSHASVVSIPKFLPSAIGQHFQYEIHAIDEFFSEDTSDKMAIVGGSKLSTKIKLLKSLVQKVDKLALGGGIAGAFSSYFGYDTLKIFAPDEYISDVKDIIQNAKDSECELVIPVDFSALISAGETFDYAIISSKDDKANIFDIGPQTVELFKKHIAESKTVLWNGPLGLFERVPFDFGTRSIADYVAELTQEGQLTSIIGGGDTSFAMKKFGVLDQMSHISTAGGAFLYYVENHDCPALESIRENQFRMS